MAEYYSSEAVIDFIRSYRHSTDVVFHMEKHINEIPAADVRPVVRGKWEEDWAGAAICSVCNEYAFETSAHHLCGWFPNFCPNCGADMRPTSMSGANEEGS